MANSNSLNTRDVHRAHVLEIGEVAPAHYQIKLQVPALASTALPGQFVHILTKPNSREWTFDPLLRRAFSIMSVDQREQTSITLLFRVVGRGTTALATARINDDIDLIGPLGKPFDLSPFGIDAEASSLFHVKHSVPHAIVVGGGVGVPPLIYLSDKLKQHGIEVSAIIGARNVSEIIGEKELKSVCGDVKITTDDGSRGHHGRVTELLSRVIAELTQQCEGNVIPVVYACGPLPMLRAVAHICEMVGVRCQVSLEENMPCGIGVCNGCVVRARRPFAENQFVKAEPIIQPDVTEKFGDEWSPYRAYRRVCVEGPACWADEIDWEYEE